MSPFQSSKKLNEKIVFNNFENRRKKHLPKVKLGQSVRTADIKRVFSKGDSLNGSYIL